MLSNRLISRRMDIRRPMQMMLARIAVVRVMKMSHHVHTLPHHTQPNPIKTPSQCRLESFPMLHVVVTPAPFTWILLHHMRDKRPSNWRIANHRPHLAWLKPRVCLQLRPVRLRPCQVALLHRHRLALNLCRQPEVNPV